MAEKALFKAFPILLRKIKLFLERNKALFLPQFSIYYIVVSCLVCVFLLLGYKFYQDGNHFSSFFIYSIIMLDA